VVSTSVSDTSDCIKSLQITSSMYSIIFLSRVYFLKKEYRKANQKNKSHRPRFKLLHYDIFIVLFLFLAYHIVGEFTGQRRAKNVAEAAPNPIIFPLYLSLYVLGRLCVERQSVIFTLEFESNKV
jgi:hypothetical protein